MNTYGEILKITTFGESHGKSLGVVIDGFPSNYKIDEKFIKKELLRRKPGQSKITTQRNENDEEFQILSGIFEGKTTGHPITLIVNNSGQKSRDYSYLKDIFRPNHADLTYYLKYGIRDWRGGGRSSGRETVSRVLAGSLFKQYLQKELGIKIYAFTKQIGNIIGNKIDYNYIEKNLLRVGDKNIYPKMLKVVEETRNNKDSIGGIVECHIKGIPPGLGEPQFDKIKSRLAKGQMSIGGIVGFEYGLGFGIVNEVGSSYNESFKYNNKNKKFYSENNKYGGILGGISTGEDIIFRVAVKPTPSIFQKQKTVDKKGKSQNLIIKGRHDPCILPRIIPVIESMVSLDILDLYLINKSKK